MFRRLIGLAFIAFALWKLWGVYDTLAWHVSNGADLDTEIAGPEFLIPGLGYILLLLGGGLIGLAKRFGAVVSIVGAGLYSLFTAAIFLTGADSSLWFDKALTSGALIIGVILAIFLKREN